MTDRAIVPRGVPKLYAGIYEQIEDDQQVEPIVLEFEDCIEQEILKCGSGANNLIDIMVSEFEHWNLPLFRGDTDLKYEILQMIREKESKISGERLHVEYAADACRYVYNRLGVQDIGDISAEVNIQYRLNICDARLEQIQNKLREQNKERFVFKDDIKNRYEARLRNPEIYTNPKGNQDLLDIDIARGTNDL